MDDIDVQAPPPPHALGQGDAAQRILPRFTAIAAWSIVALIAASFVAMSPRGFGLADESFYLLSARQHDLPTYFSSFGWMLAGLLWLCGDQLWLVRIAGAAILLGLTLVLASEFCRFLTVRLAVPVSRTDRHIVLATAGMAAFAYYREWIPTPSYNWLALCGTTVGGIALLRTDACHAAPERIDWRTIRSPALLLGLGGALTCLGKVTSAAALALVAAAWLASSPRPRKAIATGLLATSVATLLVLLHGELFEGGIRALARRAETTVALEAMLDAGHTLSDRAIEAVRETLRLPLLLFGTAPIALTAAGLTAAATFLPRRYRLAASPSVMAIAFALLTATWLVEVTLVRRMARLAEAWPALALITITIALPIAGRAAPDIRWRACVRLFALLLALPLAYAFGSNTGIYNQAGTALAFHALALLLPLYMLRRPARRDAPIGIAVATVAVYMCLVTGYAYAHPFRQAAGLAAQVHRICLLASSICADVDPAMRDYAVGLQRAAVRAGWRPGLPLIVLTGRTPGAATLLSARTPGTPWLFSGFAGSEAYALGTLRLDRTMVKKAWILTAPDAPNALSPALLTHLALPFPAGYSPVAQVVAPVPPRRQLLWKPMS